MKILPSPKRNKKAGFTLVELLTVIAIIGILASILVPIIDGSIDRATNSKSLSNLREIGKTSILYAQRYKGKALPAEADIDRDNKEENWWQIITYMSHGNKKLASRQNNTEGLRPFEDPNWKNDPDYTNDHIGIGLNSSPGLPDIDTRNADDGGNRSREFRLSQINFQGRRLLATLWNEMEIRKGNASRGSFNRTIYRYNDHVNVVYFDSHVGQFDEDEYERFNDAINDPARLGRFD